MLNKEEAEKLLDNYITAFCGLSQAMRTGTMEDYERASLLHVSAKEKLLAALTNTRKNCIEVGQGHELCDMCASGRTDLCRYTNTISSMNEIDKLRAQIAALTEPNQPMGPGEYWLTRRIKLAECKAGCRTCQSRLMIPDMTLGEWPQGDFYDESGTCIKNITGHWTPVEGE